MHTVNNENDVKIDEEEFIQIIEKFLRSRGMQEMLNDFAKEMENKVKQYPEQWYNYYNFWQQ